MAAVETLEGEVVSLKSRPAAGGAVLEFQLRAANNQARRIQAVEDPAKPLRDGDVVFVTGGTDANGILVAQTIAVVATQAAVERPRPEVESVPARRSLPRWLPYAFPACALVAIVLFVSAASAGLARGNDLPILWAGLGTLSLVLGGSGLGAASIAYAVPATLLRFTGKAFILIAFLAWWSDNMRDVEGAVELGGLYILLAATLIARLDYRELSAAVRAAGMPVTARPHWGLLVAFPRIAIGAVTVAGMASTAISHESLAFSGIAAGIVLLLASLVIRNRGKAPGMAAVKALMQFAGSVSLLVGLDFQYRVLLYSGAGAMLLFALLILFWRTFYQRATLV